MKKILSIVLALAIIFAMSATVFASELSSSRLSLIVKNVNTFLSTVNSHKKINDVVELYNFNNSIEALWFSLSGGGYIVASYKDGHVIEYSPNDLPVKYVNWDSKSRIYYGGPMSFNVIKNHMYMDIVTGELYKTKGNIYSMDYKSSLEESPKSIAATVYLSTPSSYVNAVSPWSCTITGITNLLQYYDDYHGDDVYPSTVSGVNGLRTFLYNNNYISRDPLFLSDAETLHTSNGNSFSGLTSFLNRNDVDSMYVIIQNHTLSRMKSQIGSNSRPVLLMIDTYLVDSGYLTSTHIVLCYGYVDVNATGRTYYAINNGWGSNGVLICSSDVPTSYEMMYLVD